MYTQYLNLNIDKRDNNKIEISYQFKYFFCFINQTILAKK
jgi:hypothetical protein